MAETLSNKNLHYEFRRELYDISGENIERCYQCGKCTAGCPIAFAMDLGPGRLIRYLQLGLIDEALNSNTYWICSNCLTCSTRCPREIDIANLMDGLRNIAFKRDIKPSDPSVKNFTRVFLYVIKNFGRMFEVAFVIFNNLVNLNPLKDMTKAPMMLLKGKISLYPSRFEGSGRVKEIMERWEKN